MQDRSDDFRDSFYYRAIRTRIGAALQVQYDLAKPLPDRISDLLSKLDQADAARVRDELERSGHAGDKNRAGVRKPETGER